MPFNKRRIKFFAPRGMALPRVLPLGTAKVGKIPDAEPSQVARQYQVKASLQLCSARCAPSSGFLFLFLADCSGRSLFDLFSRTHSCRVDLGLPLWSRASLSIQSLLLFSVWWHRNNAPEEAASGCNSQSISAEREALNSCRSHRN